MKQSGFTLLEVLVAMLVLSIGLLGLAGLMASSMRDNLSAAHRTQATWVAYDILDRMRANRTVALAGGYNTGGFGTAGACSASGPTAGAFVVQDIGGWRNMAACALPAGTGSVDVVAASRIATVVVRWDDSRGTQGSSVQTFTVQSQL